MPICKSRWGAALSGGAAGAVNGLLGAGGGMVLVPGLRLTTGISEEALFPTSVAVITPVCLVSLGICALSQGLPWQEAWPYLIGSTLGGWGAGLWGSRIPTALLHRVLGGLILWGGIRMLC